MPSSPTARFVGRRDERETLGAVLRAAAGGRGSLTLVRGEPGIGKTALVEEVVEHAPAGMPVWWARGRDLEGAPPLSLWHQVARAAADAGRHSLRQALAEGSAVPVGGAGGTGHERYLLFDRLGRALAETATTPCVMVADDLHWADPESLALLAFLAPDLHRLPLAVLATAHPGHEPALPRADLVLPLKGLTPDEVGRLIQGLAGRPVARESVVAAHAESGGNPLFVGEATRMLVAGGELDQSARWRQVRPGNVMAVLARRLGALAGETRSVLEAAAVLGSEVDAAVVAAVAHRERPEVDEALDQALRAEVVQSRADGATVFAHALVRSAVLAGLAAERRRALERAAATALESRSGQAAAEAVAGHWQRAGDTVQARRWAVRAGERAWASALYGEAARWFAEALDLPAGQGSAGSGGAAAADGDLWLRLADSLARGGRLDEAVARYQQVVAANRGADGVARWFAEAVLGLGVVGGGFEVRLLDPELLGLLPEALARLSDGDSALRARLLARLSVATTLHDQQGRRVELADEAVAMARRVGEPAALAAALASWCDAHAGPGDRAQRAAVAHEMVAVAGAAGDPELELLARRLAIVAHMEAGEAVLAERQLRVFTELAERLRQPHFLWYARLIGGMLAFWHGDLDRAESLGREAAALGAAAGSGNAAMLAEGALLPMLSRERGDDAWRHRLAEVNRNFPEAHRGGDMAAASLLFSAGYGGSAQAVATGLDLAPVETFLATVDDSLHLHFLTLLADGAAVAGRVDLIERLEPAVGPFAELFVLDGTAAVCYGPVGLSLGRMALARGDREAARQRFERAVAQMRTAQAGGSVLARAEATLAAVVAGPTPAAPAPAPAVTGARGPGPREPRGGHGVFKREPGGLWLVGFGPAEEAHLRATKGLGDLAVLLARPGVEVHVLDLVAAAEGRSARTSGADGAKANGADGALGPAIDPTARAAYEQRIRDLTEEIEEAEAANDRERLARADGERHALLEHLAAALGLGGRARPVGGDAERARKAVGMRIADTLHRLDLEVPALARHLRHAVHTGTWCSYQPEHPISWDL